LTNRDLLINVTSFQPYVGNCIYIKKASSHEFQAFVSKYSNPAGSDEWFNVPNEWTDAGKWSRGNWELAAIRNKEDTHREGTYVCAKNQTVYITIRSVVDIEIVRSPKPY
jgi:hypothetical protein